MKDFRKLIATGLLIVCAAGCLAGCGNSGSTADADKNATDNKTQTVADAQKNDTQKSDAQKSEAKKDDTQKSEAQKSEAKKTDTQKSEAKKADTQKSEAKKTDTQKSEAQESSTSSSASKYTMDDSSTMTIDKNGNVSISLFKLAEFNGTAGEVSNGIMPIKATDPNGDAIGFEFNVNTLELVTVDSTWALLENGTSFTFNK